MSDPIREVTELVGQVDGDLAIRRERVWANGARLGGEFLLDPKNARWLAEQLEAVASEAVSEVSLDAPPDRVSVFARGGEHGEPINLNVLNERAGARPFSLSGMSPEVARKLAAELRRA